LKVLIGLENVISTLLQLKSLKNFSSHRMNEEATAKRKREDKEDTALENLNPR